MMDGNYLEPSEIKSDMWIWDSKEIERKEPKQTIYPKMVVQPIGWRHVKFASESLFGVYKILFYDTGWEVYRPNRFYKEMKARMNDG
jgi:hypothetical protein